MCAKHHAERPDPLGASTDESPSHEQTVPLNKFRSVLEENEALNSALFALTSHFAQVQFRLRQAASSAEADDDVLKSLEEFAFQATPDLSCIRSRIDEQALSESLKNTRMEQRKMMRELRHELKGLRYEIGQRSIFVNSQKMKRERTAKRVERDRTSRLEVELRQLREASKQKDEVIRQLRLEVGDLERRLNFLKAKQSGYNINKNVESKSNSGKLSSVFERCKTILRMIFTIYMADTIPSKQKVTNRKNINWLDFKIRLEQVVIEIITEIKKHKSNHKIKDYSSDSEHYKIKCNPKILTLVRKELCRGLQDLIEFGSAAISTTLVPLVGCFPWISHRTYQLHAWEIILKYYKINNGPQYNSKPVRRLCTSYGLQIIEEEPKNEINQILQCIGHVISTHAPYKINYDLQFKAFVCAALNACKLATWLKLIFGDAVLIKSCYFPWSCPATPKFQECTKCLNALAMYKFNLDANLAVQRFENIQDVFG